MDFLACIVVLMIELRTRIIFWPFGSRMISFGGVLLLMFGEWLGPGLNLNRANLFYKLKIWHEIADVDVIGFQCEICMFLTCMTGNHLASTRNFRALCLIVRVFILLIIHE